MAGYRLTRPAQADVTQILATSARRWGPEARRRYAALLAAAIRKIGSDPEGPTTRERREIGRGVRSLHVRLARAEEPGAGVARPVHVIYYRPDRSGTILILRVLHERMEPERHFGR